MTRQGLMERTSGRLHSVASSIADHDDAIYDLMEVPEEWPETMRWDEAARGFVAFTPAHVYTPLQFLRRFTTGERQQLRALAQTDPAIDDWMYLLDRAQEVSSDDPDVTAALNYLVMLDVLTAERVAEILGD